MRFHLAALLLLAALFGFGCDENAPPDRNSQNASINRTLSNPAARAPGQAVADESLNIPQGAMWTICCDTLTAPDHVQRASELKSRLIQLTGRKDFYVIHKDGASVIYYGFYKAIREDVNPGEHARSQADLQWIRTLTDSGTGDPIFRAPLIMPIDGPDPAAPPEWNLVNAPAEAFWSLQIAAYKDFPARKKAAVDKVRELRKQGVPAYYYQGETISSVCVGLWPITAVKNQAEGSRYGDSAHTDDPKKSIMVFGGSPAPPGVDSEMKDPDGGDATVEGIRLDIQDQTLKAMIAQYPREDVNGEFHYKALPDGGRFYDESFLVQVPHDKQSEQASTPDQTGMPDQLPASPTDNGTPDPTQGALRSLGDQ
ncbi:MAG TPA: hypothetical protein VHY37_11375 [Tepidisphaeraceae bacterium]|jgi:hypothetical protein|nr:hypothetical protein [Tepidisphaeraceae bacterium]